MHDVNPPEDLKRVRERGLWMIWGNEMQDSRKASISWTTQYVGWILERLLETKGWIASSAGWTEHEEKWQRRNSVLIRFHQGGGKESYMLLFASPLKLCFHGKTASASIQSGGPSISFIPVTNSIVRSWIKCKVLLLKAAHKIDISFVLDSHKMSSLIRCWRKPCRGHACLSCSLLLGCPIHFVSVWLWNLDR